MKPIKGIFMLAIGIPSAILSIKKLTSRYKIGIYYIDRDDLEQDDLEVESMDLRGTPTHLCVCGSNAFYIKATFENYEISTYMLDMQCANCGSLATAPTPLDMEKME